MCACVLMSCGMSENAALITCLTYLAAGSQTFFTQHAPALAHTSYTLTSSRPIIPRASFKRSLMLTTQLWRKKYSKLVTDLGLIQKTISAVCYYNKGTSTNFNSTPTPPSRATNLTQLITLLSTFTHLPALRHAQHRGFRLKYSEHLLH